MVAWMWMLCSAGAQNEVAQFDWPEGSGVMSTYVTHESRVDSWTWAAAIAVTKDEDGVRVETARPHVPNSEPLPLAWTVHPDGRRVDVDHDAAEVRHDALQALPDWELWPQEVRDSASYDALQDGVSDYWDTLVQTWIGMRIAPGAFEEAELEREGRSRARKQVTWEFVGYQPCHTTRPELECVVFTKEERTRRDVRITRLVTEPRTLRPWRLTETSNVTIDTYWLWDASPTP